MKELGKGYCGECDSNSKVLIIKKGEYGANASDVDSWNGNGKRGMAWIICGI
jgi:hypothetical protein